MKKFLLFLASVFVTGGMYADTYSLVTSADQLTSSAQCLIVNSEAKKAMGQSNSNGNNRLAVDVTISDNKIVPGDNVEIVTLEKIGSNYNFAVAGGYLAAGSSSSNYLKTVSNIDDNSTATINISSDGTASVVFQGSYTRNTMQFNSASALFACYASASQKPIQLYVKTSGEGGGAVDPDPVGPEPETGSFSLEWGSSNWPGTNQYNTEIESTTTFGGSTWTLYGFSNNNNAWDVIKCGTKTANNVVNPEIYNNTKLTFGVTKIVLNTKFQNSGANDKLKGASLIISQSADFSNPVNIPFDGYTTAGEWTFTVPEYAANYGFFKIHFDAQTATNNGWLNINTFTVYLESAKKDAGLSFSQNTFEVELGGKFTAPTLSYETTAAITYSSSNTSVATVGETTGDVKIVGVGTTTITATAEENDTYMAGSASYTINVTPGGVISVADALGYIEGGYNGKATVKGYISKIDEIDTGSYGNATYYIVDAMGNATALEVYRGYGVDGTKFNVEGATLIHVGDLVVVEGTILSYSGTPEFTTGSKITSLTPAVQIKGSMTLQPDNYNGSSDQPDLGSPKTYQITASYNAEGSYLTINGFANLDPVTFLVDVKNGTATARKQVSRSGTFDGSEYEYFYSNVKTKEFGMTGTIYKDSDGGQCVLYVDPWGEAMVYPGNETLFFDNQNYNTVVNLNFMIEGLPEKPAEGEFTPNAAIEGKWSFTLNGHYLGNYSLGEFTEVFEATLEGTTVRFESSGSEYNIVAEFTDETTLTFKQVAVGSTTSTYVLTQSPYVNTAGVDDLEELTEQAFTATYDADKGTITFPENSGLRYGFFSQAGELSYWDDAFDFVTAIQGAASGEPALTISNMGSYYDEETATLQVVIVYDAANLPADAQVYAIITDENDSENVFTELLEESPAYIELTELAEGAYKFNVMLVAIDAEEEIICTSEEKTLEAAVGGIGDITVDGAPVRYFNLQGVELSEPAAGTTVIRVRGNKATKILVK